MCRKETGVQCLCVREGENSCVHLCVSPDSACDVCAQAYTHIGWEHVVHLCACVSVCVHVCVCVCMTWQRGGGALLKSTPLLPCSTCWISTSSFPWSRPSQPPAHLHKAQTGGDVTNKPGTHSAGCLLYMNSFPLSRHDKKETQDRAQAPAYTFHRK